MFGVMATDKRTSSVIGMVGVTSSSFLLTACGKLPDKAASPPSTNSSPGGGAGERGRKVLGVHPDVTALGTLGYNPYPLTHLREGMWTSDAASALVTGHPAPFAEIDGLRHSIMNSLVDKCGGTVAIKPFGGIAINAQAAGGGHRRSSSSRAWGHCEQQPIDGDERMIDGPRGVCKVIAMLTCDATESSSRTAAVIPEHFESIHEKVRA